jgi:hypothetical protein
LCERQESKSWRRTIFAVRVLGYATMPEESWTRFSSFWGTFPFRQQNDTLAASSACVTPVNDRIGIEPEADIAS